MNIIRRWFDKIEPSTDDPTVFDDIDIDALEPMSIHANYITTHWEQYTDHNDITAAELVLTITGISPYSPEPITVKVGLRGAALGIIQQTLLEKFLYWIRNFEDDDEASWRRAHENDDGDGEAGAVV